MWQHTTKSLGTPLTHQFIHQLLQSWIHHLAEVQPPKLTDMMCCMRHKQLVSALWGWKEGSGVYEHKRKKGDDWPEHSSEKRCHWLPYLKEMRRAEEGGTGRESRIKSEERERKKERRGILFPKETAPKVSLSLK